MAVGQIDVTLPVEYNNSPLRALNIATRRMLSNFLDVEGSLVLLNNEREGTGLVNDYTGLAELAGFRYQDIMNMRRQRSPTTELLQLWTSNNGTVGELWTFLHCIERYDVLKECKRSVVHDCRRFLEHEQMLIDAEQFMLDQDSTVSMSEMEVDETRFVTIDDVRTLQRTFYDAFICYSSKDTLGRRFLYMLIDELEKERGLKLFVPGRDDLPGSAEHTITAYLIEQRCKRVVILLSRVFLESEECDFQMKFAHALSPAARSKRLIPIIRERDTPIPRILSSLSICDFTRLDMVEWIWNRLESAIKAPVGPITYFDNENILTFPSPRRLDEHADVPSLEPEGYSNRGDQSNRNVLSLELEAHSNRGDQSHRNVPSMETEENPNMREQSGVATD